MVSSLSPWTPPISASCPGYRQASLGQAQRRRAVLPQDAGSGGRGAKKLDNYQNFAKAFKVRDFRALMASQKANDARLKSAVEFGQNEMSEGSELYQSVLRAVLYAVMELVKNVDGDEVISAT